MSGLVMKIVGAVAGVPTAHDGRYLVEYDPTTLLRLGFCHLVSTVAKRDAKVYESMEALQKDWAWAVGQRPDGKPDRPLTAFTIEIESAPDGSVEKERSWQSDS